MRRIGLILSICAGICSLPLIFIIFYYTGDSSKQWISNLAFVLLCCIGAIGVILGFTKYVIRGEPGPISAYRQQQVGPPTKGDESTKKPTSKDN